MNMARTMRRGIITTAIVALCAGITETSYAAYEDSLKGYWRMDESNRNDNFGGASLDTNRWGIYSETPTIDSGRLKCSAGSGSWAASGVISSSNPLSGYFDVQVDFNASSQPTPSTNWIDSTIRLWGTNYWYDVRSRRDASGNFSYLAYTSDGGGYAWGSDSTDQSQGKLRIVRDAAGLSGYRWNGTDWYKFASVASPDASPMTYIVATENVATTGASPLAYFDNFRVANEPVADAKGVNGGTADGATSVAGKTGFGNALNFNGTSDNVQIANESNFDFDRINTFSAGAWVKTGSSSVQRLISKMANDSPYTGYEFLIDGSGGIVTYLVSDYAAGNYIHEKTIQTGFNDNNWHYVSISYDGSSGADGLKIYVDGTEKETTIYKNSLTGSILNNVSVTLGSRNDQAYYLNGSLDDAAIWSRELSSEEIKNIYRFGTEAYESEIGTWNSTGTTEWASGWSQTGAPTESKDAYVNSGTAVVSTSGDVAKDLYVGYDTGDSGAISITTGDLAAANQYIGRTGTGSVTQTGGTNTIADTLYIGQNAGSTGTYNLQGGILKAHAVTLGAGASSFNFTGGTLKTYSFTGDLVIGDNAVIAPGSSPGIMDVYGEFVLNGTYQAELGGLTPGTEYDQIVVHGGNITLGEDSVIELAQWDSFIPEVGDSFILMDWDEGYTFTDNGYEFDPGVYGLPGDWVLSVNGTQFEAQYIGATAVPEPGCAFGLLLGFFVPGLRKVLKRKVLGSRVKEIKN